MQALAPATLRSPLRSRTWDPLWLRLLSSQTVQDNGLAEVTKPGAGSPVELHGAPSDRRPGFHVSERDRMGGMMWMRRASRPRRGSAAPFAPQAHGCAPGVVAQPVTWPTGHGGSARLEAVERRADIR